MIVETKRNFQDFFKFCGLISGNIGLFFLQFFPNCREECTYILRFMEQNKCLHNFVKMMKLTFLALCISVLQINENLATSPELLPCKQGQPCNMYGCEYGTHNIGISYYVNF